MKKMCILAAVTTIVFHPNTSNGATTMVQQNMGEQFTYTPDQDLVSALSALRTGDSNQDITLPEVNEGDPLTMRPEIRIHPLNDSAIGINPFEIDLQGNPATPLSIFSKAIGIGRMLKHPDIIYLMIRATISKKADSELELPGKRLLTTKGQFKLKTEPGRIRPYSNAYVQVYCGNGPAPLNDLSSFSVELPAGPETSLATPQTQIDFDFAYCRDDVNVYYVAKAQNIRFIDFSWMITKSDNTSPPSGTIDNPSRFGKCLYSHKTAMPHGRRGIRADKDAYGAVRTCDKIGNWRTSCDDGSLKTEELGCF